ncbi:phage major capsid protein [Streptomyces sp. NBC_00525]|uniref:phage major capsid protein n=1 Tax=Streptomyces sp. NBC_00525 TaxID=2903660 RepID=UPI002E80EB04|nr:phage major capsid protein [Streptomyces sp. NBC_00525]WUC97413.1 phage major capsid protein [Streptomyces sp. NBC_00525]
MSLADALNSRRLQVWNEMQELVDRTDAEGRSFSGEEDAKWANMNAEIAKIDERIKSVRDAEARTNEVDAIVNRSGRKLITGADADAELRAWARGERGKGYEVRPVGPVNFRDLTTGTAATPYAGNTVPQSFYAQLVQHLIENGALLGAGVTVLNTASGEGLTIPKTTAHSTASLTAEGATITESDPVFGSVELGAYKYATAFQVSSELLQDSGVDLTGYLASQAGRALGNKFGTDIVTGAGSSGPKGIVTASTLGVTGAAAISGGLGSQATAGQGVDYLIDLFHKVIAPYRQSPSCGWLMSDPTAAMVRKLKTSEGAYVWQPSVIAGQPDLLLSKPVTIDTNVADMAADAVSIVFGDFSRYFVRMAGPIRFERSDDFAFTNDLVTFRAVMRADGDLVDTTGAVQHFKGGAAS